MRQVICGAKYNWQNEHIHAKIQFRYSMRIIKPTLTISTTKPKPITITCPVLVGNRLVQHCYRESEAARTIWFMSPTPASLEHYLLSKAMKSSKQEKKRGRKNKERPNCWCVWTFVHLRNFESFLDISSVGSVSAVCIYLLVTFRRSGNSINPFAFVAKRV